jgi:hypothetical protein
MMMIFMAIERCYRRSFIFINFWLIKVKQYSQART